MKRSHIIEALVLYFILTFLVILVAGSIWFDAEHAAIKDFSRKQIFAAHATMLGLQTALQSISGDALYLASLPEIKSMELDAIRKRFWQVYNVNSSILASLSRMDSLGIIRVTVPFSEFENSDITEQRHIKRILASQQPVIGGPINTVQGFDAIIIHYPIFIEDSIFNGTIAVLVSFDSLVTSFFSPLLFQTGQIPWLANQEGEILVHPKVSSRNSIENIFSDIEDTVMIQFIEDYPPQSDGYLIYRTADGSKRMLCWSSMWVGIEHWVLGIDNDCSVAFSTLSSINTKLILGATLALILALLLVIRIVVQTTKRHRIEQHNQFLKISTEHREKLDSIYRFAQSMLDPDSTKNPLPDIVEAVAKVANVPFTMAWTFDSNHNTLIPGAYHVDDFKIMDELHCAGIDLPHIEIDVNLGDIELSNLKNCITISIGSIDDKNSALAVVLHTLRSIRHYTHLTVMPLSLRERFFGCVIIPSALVKNVNTELLETFRFSVSQVLYINAILDELSTSNKIHKDILNTIDNAVFLVNSKFEILSVSPMFYRIYEVSGKAVGKDLFEVVPFLLHLHKERAYMEVMRTKTSIETEETHILTDGRKRYTLTKIIPIVEDGSQVKRILTIVDDVTSFRVLEEQLKHTAEDLIQKNRQFEKLSITDELTQLRNYRYFREQLPKYIHHHNSIGEPLALLAMDLDEFKRYNDTFGHQAGDRLLAEIAEIVRGFLRSDDFAARYGGDEFILVLSETNTEEAMDTAERLCRRISSTPFPDAYGGRSEYITASIGVAMLTKEICDAEELHRRADTALYVSKELGKNQTTLHEVKVEESS